MKKVLLLLLAGAICSSSFAQRKVKYKDIYDKIGKEPAEHSLLKLQEYQKLTPEFPNTYVQSALIQWSWLQNEDPFLNYESVTKLIYDTKLYMGLAINKIEKDEKEVKKNKAYYTNLGLGNNPDDINQADVIAELNRLMGVVKDYEENVTKIITNFNNTIEKYNECIAIYRGIVARQSNYKNLLLTTTTDLRAEMNQLSQNYDSALTYFGEFKKALHAFRKYRLKEYDQQTKTTPIVTYRLEGLTSSNFINPEIPIWDYKSWVSEAFKEMDGNVTKLKTNTEKEIKNMRARVAALESANAETDSIQQIAPPNALVNLVEKYDYESLLSASLKYEAALANLKIASMRSANNTDNPESFNEDFSQKGSYYYDLYLMSQEAQQALAMQSSRITDNNCQKHEPIINSLYGGKSQLMSGYTSKQESDIDAIMASNFENMKLYTVFNMSPESVSVSANGAKISAVPYTGTFADAPAGQYITVSTTRDNGGNRYICGYHKTSDTESAGFIAKLDSGDKLLWTKDIKPAPGINNVVQIIPSKYTGFVAVTVNSKQDICKTTILKMDDSGHQTAQAAMQSTLYPTVSCYDEISDQVTTAFKGSDGNENTTALCEALLETATMGQTATSQSPSFQIKGQIADIVPVAGGYIAICNYKEINAGGQSLSADSDIAAVVAGQSGIKAGALKAGKNAVAFKAFVANAENIAITGAYADMATGITASQKPAFIVISADGKFTYHN